MYEIVKVNQENKNDFIGFLENYKETSLFLLGNINEYGFNLTDSMNSGNFKYIMKNKKIVAAYCLAKRGNLLLQTDKVDDYSEIIYNSCKDEAIVFKGIIGDWISSNYFLNYYRLQNDSFYVTAASKEKLYSLDLKNFNKNVKLNGNETIRLLKNDDFPIWDRLNQDFTIEIGLTVQGSEQDRKLDFSQKVNLNRWLGLFIGNELISTSALTTHYKNIGQVGGVYTLPKFRRKGFSNKCMIQYIHECKTMHHLETLILFTGENNIEAQKLYEGLGFKMVGHFALLFGTHTSTINEKK